jgi:hypothetical protein
MRWGEMVRLVPLALAACLATATPSLAEEAGSPGHGSAAPVAAAPPKIAVTIPAVQAVRSSIDEATLRAILSGDLANHAEELATLKAASIRVPEVTVAYAVPKADGTLETATTTMRDIRLNKVAKGIAQAVIIGSTETVSSNGTARFGKVSAEDFDIGRLLAFFGLVKGDPTERRATVYRKLLTNGGTASSPEVNCTFGPSSVDRVSIRPLKVPFTDALGLLEKADIKENGLSQEDTATLITFFVDVMDAVEISPMKIGGFDCAGKDDEGKPIAIKVGNTTVGAFARGRYPEIVTRNIGINVEGDGEMKLGEFRFKGFDLSGALATLKQAGGEIDDAWLEANYRLLLPAFDGLALSRFAMDIPDPDNPGERVKASIGSFDLTLRDYVNGIPTDASTSASHIVALLPEKTSDSNVQLLLDYGVDKFDIGFDVAVKWDEKAGEIRLSRFNVSGADMGSLSAVMAIGGATRSLYSTDALTQLASALVLTFKSAKVDVRDAGLASIIMRAAAADAHKDVATLRAAAAAFAKGSVVLFLGPAANTGKVADAIAEFVEGKRFLSVSAKARDEDGVPLLGFQELRRDPAAILEKLDIDATVK